MIIGLDVGGTHTDVVLLGIEGLVRQIKVPTNSSDLFATVLTGLEKITEGIDPARISRAVLSTTLTTNRIVQGRIPDVGMIVSAGPGMDPELFRTGPHYHTVAGAIDHRGREITPIDAGQVLKVAENLKNNGIRYVGVVSKFSVRNPAHEVAIGDLLGDRFEKVFLGHRIAGQLNFPRRIATTFLNASVYPVHKDFFEAVVNSLAKKGLSMPIRILKPDGGNMRFDASIDHPAQTILSGPAASVMGSVAFAPKDEVCLVLDIGGTTTDMAVLVDGVPLLDPIGISIGGHKTLIRSLETVSIGVGGDSAVRVVDGKIQIGPDRLGMAMAYGGPVPTPTDAMFLLGIGDGGDPHKAREAIQLVADALGTDLQDAANRIFKQACGTILDEAGITWYEVEDPAHWFNQEQIDRFHETLVKKTGNANIARDSGRYMSTSASAGAVKQYALGLMNLTAIYLLMGKMYPFMSRGAKIKVKKLGPNRVEITSTPMPGVKEKPYQCDNRMGIFEGAPKFYEDKLAHIEHPSCFHRGDDCCRYIISWQRMPLMLWKHIRNYFLLFSVLASLLLF